MSTGLGAVGGALVGGTVGRAVACRVGDVAAREGLEVPGWAYGGDVLDVTTVGAIGDGVRDNTDALQMAISIGGPVWVPPGDYLVSAPLVISNAVDITFSDGARIVAASGFVGNLLQITSRTGGVILRNPVLDGSGAANHAIFSVGTSSERLPGFKVIGGHLVNMAGNGVWAAFVDGAVLDRVLIQNTDRAIRITDCIGCVIRSCTVEDTARKAISVVQSADTKVLDCVVRRTALEEGVGIYVAYQRSTNCIVSNCYVEGTAGNGIKLSRRASGVRVSGCTVRKSANDPSGTQWGIVLQGTPDSVVSDCEVHVENRGGFQIGHHPHPIDGGPIHDVILSNCVVQGYNGRSPAAAVSVVGTSALPVERVNVARCNLQGQVSLGAHAYYCRVESSHINGRTSAAVRIFSSDAGNPDSNGHTIANCHLRSGREGVRAFSAASDIIVTGCHVFGSRSEGFAGIEAGGAGGRWVVSSNVIQDFRGWAIYVQNGNGQVKASTIQGNVIRNCAFGIRLRRRGTISGNAFSGVSGEKITLDGSGNERGEAYGNGPDVEIVRVIGVID